MTQTDAPSYILLLYSRLREPLLRLVLGGLLESLNARLQLRLSLVGDSSPVLRVVTDGLVSALPSGNGFTSSVDGVVEVFRNDARQRSGSISSTREDISKRQKQDRLTASDHFTDTFISHQSKTFNPTTDQF